MNIIAQLIQTPCTYLTKLSFDISYQTVIDTWELFCNGDTLPKQVTQIFLVHKIKKNHIILYNNKGQTKALLLCFINGRYMNFLIPNYELDKTCVAIWF